MRSVSFSMTSSIFVLVVSDREEADDPKDHQDRDYEDEFDECEG